MPTKPKLSAPSRQRLEDLRGERIRPERVAMFLRGAAAFTPEQIEQLKSDGAAIRTRAGIVLTADVPLDAVERVMGHDFIVSAELSAPLYPEPKDGQSGGHE